MRPPTLAELRQVAAGPLGRATAPVRLELADKDVIIAFVRTLNTLELDAFDLAVAAGGSPRAELVGRALYDPVDPPPDRAALIQEIGGWPGWITDALFGAALTLNRLVERAYPTHATADHAPAGKGGNPLYPPPMSGPSWGDEADAERALAITEDQRRTLAELLAQEPEGVKTRQQEVTAKARGIMRTLEGLGAFQRVTPGGHADA